MRQWLVYNHTDAKVKGGFVLELDRLASSRTRKLKLYPKIGIMVNKNRQMHSL